MLTKIIATALLWLAPHLGQQKANHYAGIIEFESRWYKVHPALVLAIGHFESRWRNHKISPTNDYGLLQIHVNRRGSHRFYGREKELFDPRVNIREAFRILDMWRTYHNRWCKAAHPYWAHYKWGRRVLGTKHTHKTRRLYRLLVQKFWPKGHPQKGGLACLLNSAR